MKKQDIILVAVVVVIFAVGMTMGLCAPEVSYQYYLPDGAKIITTDGNGVIVDGIEYDWTLRIIDLQMMIGLLLIAGATGIMIGFSVFKGS